MGQILRTARLEAQAAAGASSRAALHADHSGECMVQLGELPILAAYTVTPTHCGEIIEIESLLISGHTVGVEFFDSETLRVWVAEIERDRADDLRIARDAAEFDAAEAL